MELKEINEKLNQHLRFATYPVAIRMCESAAELPEKVRMPKRDFGVNMALCQGIGVARRYGLTVAIGKEGYPCVYGSLALGFLKPKEGFLDGSRWAGSYHASAEASGKTAQSLSRLEYGKYQYALVAPLRNATFEPHIVMVYGNPAQIMRMVMSSLYESGGLLNSSTCGGFGCFQYIGKTMQSGECQFLLSGNGDRVIGTTQDHEVAFSMPLSKVESVLRGLDGLWKVGPLQRYPIITYALFEPRFAPAYDEMRQYLEEADMSKSK